VRCRIHVVLLIAASDAAWAFLGALAAAVIAVIAAQMRLNRQLKSQAEQFEHSLKSGATASRNS
jgi:Flp pilus assembly protein TadB